MDISGQTPSGDAGFSQLYIEDLARLVDETFAFYIQSMANQSNERDVG
ncbi:hypothetical protein [Desulfosporosinus burensis]